MYPPPVGRLADLPHHDGSARYASPGPHALGDVVTVRLRVPAASRAERVRVRFTRDAEPWIAEARIEREADDVTWWIAEIPVHNPVVDYRFVLEGGAIGHAWLTDAGVSPHDVPDATDFRITTADPAPAWLADAVGYEIFLDRFARSGALRPVPDWAEPADWEDPLRAEPGRGTRQLYGGDLRGVEERLDHVARLGVDLLYLTPFFPARSNHRYDAETFGRVDPLLGGDEALASLVAAAHRRGMRVIGDLTFNHTGDHHEWFTRARRDPDSTEAGFYLFGDEPGSYVAWHDVPSLPKLDHRSSALADRLYRGDDSVTARFLTAPFGLDGWRIDCANTTGRHADADRNRAVACAARRTVDRVHGDAWLVAEHCHDATGDLTGHGWHGVMAYQWFTRPLWSWLAGSDGHTVMGAIPLPRLAARAAVHAMRWLAAGIPWAARTASMTLLDSHDTTRFRTAVGGDRRRHLVGLGALLTMPGVPTIFAGSEVGVEGATMDGCRVPFPWDEARWDPELFEATRSLIAVRRAQPALRHGGLRWLDATADSMTFVRETDDSAAIVHLAGAGPTPVAIPTSAVAGDGGFTTLIGDRAVVGNDAVELPGRAPVTVLRGTPS